MFYEYYFIFPKARLKFLVQSRVSKGMFVGNANNSTNSFTKALGIFISIPMEKKKKVWVDVNGGFCLHTRKLVPKN